jgi:signal transduction histidine kinase
LPKVESSPLLVDTFLELITNAEKAMAESRDKRLTVRTRLEAGKQADWVVIEMEDTGCGIAEDRMNHLWDMFQQSDNGLGYGLWWLRTFIVRQGGTIDCTSRPGEGSTFTLRLPAVSGED